MVVASAPGKVILLGEHAVVYGEPAIATAIDLRTRVRATRRAAGSGTIVNGYPLTPAYHTHLVHALDVAAEAIGAPLADVAFETESRIPSAAGLGSSAALTTATLAAVLALAGATKDEEHLARLAYEVEWRAQGGRGSPTDTSTVAHGRAVLVDRDARERLLWTVKRGERTWHLHHLDAPAVSIVIGNTQERGRTTDQVAKVAKLVAKSGFAKEIVKDVGKSTRDGIDALRAGDWPRLGRAMDRAHNSLTTLGVSTPRLDQFCETARKAGALGAKLTGSGGGGSMIALAKDPERVAAALAKHRAQTFVVALGAEGARVEEGP